MPDSVGRRRRPTRRRVAAARVALVSAVALVMIGCAWPDDAAATTVRVSPGNTLTQIANTYGTSVAALVADNGIGDPDLIEAGTVIDVPTAPTSSYATARSTSASTSTSSVAAIVDANGIGDPSHVEIGAQLVVPEGAAYGGAGSGSGGLLSAQVQRSTLPAGLLSHPERLALRPLFEQWASDSGVPVALLEAMCWWESGWQMSAVSSTGAVGVGQLEPSTVAKLRVSLGQPGLQATNTSDNIEMAAAYLHQLLVQTGGDEDRALAGYYQGLPSVQRSGMFASTVQYVHGILSFTDLFA